MGVDATVFVLARYSDKRDGTAFVAASINLLREGDLWAKLRNIFTRAPTRHAWDRAQVPRGSWTGMYDGRPEEWGGHECGYLFDDSYGNPLISVPMSLFKGAHRFAEYGFNQRALRFLAEQYPDNDVLIVWH